MEQEIYLAIVKAIATQKRLDPSQVSIDSTLQELGISSLDAITIVYEIEDTFDIEVDNEQLEKLQSVRDIVEGITKLVEAKG